jgi:hypothetical protein
MPAYSQAGPLKDFGYDRKANSKYTNSNLDYWLLMDFSPQLSVLSAFFWLSIPAFFLH